MAISKLLSTTFVYCGSDNVRPMLEDLKSSVSDYFPMIKRGFSEEKEEDAPEVVTSGWKHDVISRKEREVGLR